jgi:hypothetical protein
MFKRSLLVAMACLVASGSAAYAGRTRGPGIDHGVAEAYSTVQYHDRFAGGRWATITVDGDGDTDLDLFVYDENGNLVASDTDRLDYCVVSFVPRRTGTFRIVVENLGSVYNRFTIETN